MTTLPVAPSEYDRQQEQKFRSIVETALIDIEAAIFALRTTYGTLGLGQGDLVLANGANNNIAPGFDTHLRISGPTGSFTTTGFSNGERGRLMLIANTTAQQWTIVNESASSTAQNRIITGTGVDVVLTGTGGAHAVFLYDSTSERWRLFATQG
jgi:hypothetical protein